VDRDDAWDVIRANWEGERVGEGDRWDRIWSWSSDGRERNGNVPVGAGVERGTAIERGVVRT
jgi:hypothetical protein